jgi:hypothetical protein
MAQANEPPAAGGRGRRRRPAIGVIVISLNDSVALAALRTGTAVLAAILVPEFVASGRLATRTRRRFIRQDLGL